MKTALTIGIVLLVLSSAAALAAPKSKQIVERGRYLATIGNCGVCHAARDKENKVIPDTMSGGVLGRKLKGVGVFWAPNLTNDKETGLGGWSDQEIIDAIRKGTRPDGRVLSPTMPTESFGVLTQADAKAIVAYLRSLKPVKNKVPDPIGIGNKSPTPYYGVLPPGEVKD